MFKSAVRALQRNSARSYYTCPCEEGKKCKNRPRNWPPGQVIAKTCKPCSFWEQEIANCEGRPWKLKGPEKSTKAPLCAKPVSLKECAKKYPPRTSGEEFDFCDYKSVPDIPQATWDSYKDQN